MSKKLIFPVVLLRRKYISFLGSELQRFKGSKVFLARGLYGFSGFTQILFFCYVIIDCKSQKTLNLKSAK
ncbi:hypothetical protein B0A64_07360 [Flavobacterium araucananum]|uniref:Uncharacterized protein n=1 Tax=Flavobacterium araucananum TaxID=946678 RepID=A0A227PE70_9FLAO|nr:hypothetical protein B0A64_07360 [Flavobacterium araucananum]